MPRGRELPILDVIPAFFQLMAGNEKTWVSLKRIYPKAAEARKSEDILNKEFEALVRNTVYRHCSNCGFYKRPQPGSRRDVFERDETRRGCYRLRPAHFREWWESIYGTKYEAR